MLRVFVPKLPALGSVVALSVEAQRHAKVKRLASGNVLRFFDGNGGEAEARYADVHRRTI